MALSCLLAMSNPHSLPNQFHSLNYRTKCWWVVGIIIFVCTMSPPTSLRSTLLVNFLPPRSYGRPDFLPTYLHTSLFGQKSTQWPPWHIYPSCIFRLVSIRLHSGQSPFPRPPPFPSTELCPIFLERLASKSTVLKSANPTLPLDRGRKPFVPGIYTSRFLVSLQYHNDRVSFFPLHLTSFV